MGPRSFILLDFFLYLEPIVIMLRYFVKICALLGYLTKSNFKESVIDVY